VKALVQRVSEAQIWTGGSHHAEIGPGLLVFLGVAVADTPDVARWLADKVGGLRIFSDESGKMTRGPLQVSAQCLVVSQFTLLADMRRGLRPDFGRAAPKAQALELYGLFCERLHNSGLEVKTGVFGAHMDVRLCNDGPVTILIDTDEVMPDGSRTISDRTRNA